MNFRHHPDNFIYLGDLQLPLPFFEEQEPGYALPEKAIGREYSPGDRHILSDGSNQWAGDLPWEEGDRYLASLEVYRSALALEQQPPLTLEQLKARKVAELDRACTAAIDSGFESAALGTVHRYSSQLADQFNLKATRDLALEFGAEVEYVCTDLNGLKTGRSHTPAQMSQVFFDGLGLKRFLILEKFHPLRLQVLAATDAAEVEAIEWGD